MSQQATWRTYISAPRWAGVALFIRKAATVCDVSVESLSEEKGWIQSTVFFKVRGEVDKIKRFESVVRKSMEDFNRD